MTDSERVADALIQIKEYLEYHVCSNSFGGYRELDEAWRIACNNIFAAKRLLTSE